MLVVELRREESRCRTQDRVRGPELAVLLLELGDPCRLCGRVPDVSPRSTSDCRTHVLIDSTP